MNITEADQRLVTTNEARKFDQDLRTALQPFELAEMRLARLIDATEGGLGGWPEGFEFPTDAVAGYALLADVLENEAEKMLEWAKDMRTRSAYLWFINGPAADA